MIRKRAALFDPYFDTIGGGEVYTASVAECLIHKGYQVDLFWEEEGIRQKIHKYLGIDIRDAKINGRGFQLFSKKGNLLQKWLLARQYDLIFYVSDGSVPFLFSRNNILHFQIPFTIRQGLSLSNRVKLKSIHHVVSNSNFTKRVIDLTYGVDSSVIYPPINIRPRSRRKENIILSVGRFTTTLHNKRQDVLVDGFKQMVDSGLKGWQLKLIGSAKPEGQAFVNKLQASARGYPIEILQDASHARLEEEYARARLFWHAAGFSVNQEEHPEQTEHFGIATAEAMSAGCVPVVINKGGQPEIVNHGENGYLWDSLESLKKHTLHLIKSPEKMERMSTTAMKKSQQFSKERFYRELVDLLDQ